MTRENLFRKRHFSISLYLKQTGLSAGRNLGGSSNLNIMIHLRGHAKDYDSWAHQTGYPDWSWDSVLPFFKSYENYEIPGDDCMLGAFQIFWALTLVTAKL